MKKIPNKTIFIWAIEEYAIIPFKSVLTIAIKELKNILIKQKIIINVEKY